MNHKESIEFLKWVINFPLHFGFGNKWNNEYIQGEIDNFLKIELQRLRESNSLSSLKKGRFGFYERFLGEVTRQEYRSGDYSPLIQGCSWSLNREYRQIHDKICEYLYI